MLVRSHIQTTTRTFLRNLKSNQTGTRIKQVIFSFILKKKKLETTFLDTSFIHADQWTVPSSLCINRKEGTHKTSAFVFKAATGTVTHRLNEASSWKAPTAQCNNNRLTLRGLKVKYKYNIFKLKPMLKSTNLYIRLHGFLKTAFIEFSKGTVCNSRLLFLSLFLYTSVHTSIREGARRRKNDNWGISWLIS